MRIEVLGTVRVAGDAEPLAVERPAQRRVLSILALAGGNRVSTEQLIDRFWVDAPPETARAAIQTHISALRRLLDQGVIVTEGYGYRLNVDDHKLDSHEFTGLVRSALSAASDREWQTALDTAEYAVSLWRGDPYVELANDDFAQAEIIRLTELYVGLLETRAESLIGLGREQDLLADLEGLVIEHPYRERLWEQLMTARYRLGRHTEALRAFQQVTDHLTEIGVEPGKPLKRLEERILLHDQTLTQTKNNLPVELDSFIGRETEQQELVKLLDDHRLVTLTGPGGAGKTRLATHTAQQLLDHYPDGIWFVELADIDDPSIIPATIATAVGLPGDDYVIPVLKRRLATQQVLLIIDNCEHVVEGVSEILTVLLGAAPGITVLTTSRTPLRAPGEHIFHVPGLTLPKTEDAMDAIQSDAVRLFQRRAEQTEPNFDLKEQLGDVLSICIRLDALPLAIELAAARVSSLGVDEIERHLDRSLSFLTSGTSTAHSRHQTLEAAIEWSYQLASDETKHALAILSVFRGGFDLSMAVWILGEDAPRIVSELVDQSLAVSYRGTIGRRYRILETIRQFGLARAREGEVEQRTGQRHAEWCASFANRIWESWQGPRFDQMEAAIHEEFENLMAAFDRAENSGDRQLAGRIAEGLLWHWHLLGYESKAIGLFDRAIETCADDDRHVALLSRRVSARFNSNDTDGALADAENAYRLAKRLEPSVAKAYAVSTYAHIFAVRPDLDAREGLSYARQAVAIAKETAIELLIAVLELDLALALAWAGQGEEARLVLQRAVAMVDRTGDPYTVAYTYYQAATVAMQLADYRREGLADFSMRLERWMERHPQIAHSFRMGWIEWARIQRGELADIESKLKDWSAKGHLEGFVRLGNLVPLATTLWMQGSLEQALVTIEECESVGVNPRWYHDFYPLKVDVLVDVGRLDAAQAAADVYLGYDTDATESAMKLGVLNPLVRGIIDFAESSTDKHEALAEAESLVAQMEEMLSEHAPPMDGSVAMETPNTHLQFARSELTRLTGPDPSAWEKAMRAADFIYFRLYAQIRLGESLVRAGQTDEGRSHLEYALAEARRIGASRLVEIANQVISG